MNGKDKDLKGFGYLSLYYFLVELVIVMSGLLVCILVFFLFKG